MSRLTLDELAARVQHDGISLKRAGSGYVGRCPGHDDHHPSLHLFKGRAGEGRFYCQAGCDINGPSGKGGDSYDWTHFITGRNAFREAAANEREDPKLVSARLAAQKAEAVREQVRQRFLDRNPDAPPEAEVLAEYVQRATKDMRLDQVTQRLHEHLAQPVRQRRGLRM